jgi:hypothetical protein
MDILAFTCRKIEALEKHESQLSDESLLNPIVDKQKDN